jgi:para-aminobenzoate synthetase / 4-amino-4-deoxychorismate lyase
VVSRLLRRPLGWDLTPVAALRLVRADAHPVALFGAWAGGCDVIGSEPLLTRAAPGPAAPLADVFDAPWPSGPVTDRTPDGAPGADPAFGGGWIGYLGYSAAGEALPPSGPRRLPTWWFGYYDHVLRHDRAAGEWFFEALWTAERAAALERRFQDLCQRPAQAPHEAPPGYTCGPFRLIPGAQAHQAAVAQTVEYIGQGDIFQANICLRAEAGFTGAPLDAFAQAVTVLDPPYAAFMDVPGGAVASMSPELFLRRTGRAVVSRPIKGTAHRSKQPDRATRQRGDLEGSAKNRAENVMIVDLVRNDLSRVCEPGSVTAPRLLDTEPHPGVWHLVSEVRGTLTRDAGDGDLIRAAFPPGSVTGAPKVRALEIIDELEAAPREVYTGAIGYRSPVAGLELNVAIRTFEFARGRVWVGAGGGIVADSDPQAEYTECLHKAGPLIAAIGSRIDTGDGASQEPLTQSAPRQSAGVFTSLLVTAGQTAGLDAHLARLEASTRRLYGKDLPLSLPADLEQCLATRPAGRLRITVRPVGGPLQARVEVVPLTPAPQAVTLRPAVVPGGFGAHKWQDRRLLAGLARAAGQQVLLIDADGHVLETDRANVFAVIGGVLRTPPADDRILPGTARQAILDAASADGVPCGTGPLPLADLGAASEVFVTNAVYGVLPVHSVDGCPQSWDLGPVAKHFEMVLASRPPDAPPAPRPARSHPAAAARHGRTLTPRATKARPLVVLVDNYDSFTYNLAHLLVTAGCQVEVVRNDEVPAARVSDSAAAAVVISPGPCAPPEAGISVDVVRGCARRGIPLLGICLGHQVIAAAFGAAVIRAPRPVHGQVCRVTHDGRGVLAGLPQGFEATRYHSLIVDEHSLPPALTVTARSGPLPMGLRHATSRVEGVQFHPESILTTHGAAIIRNFVRAAVRGDSRAAAPAVPGIGARLALPHTDRMGVCRVGIFDEAEKAAAKDPNEVQNLTQDAEKFADQETGGKFDSEIADAGSELDKEIDQQDQQQQ